MWDGQVGQALQVMASVGLMVLYSIRSSSARSRSMTASSISSMNSRSYYKVPNPRSRDPFCRIRVLGADGVRRRY